MELYIYNRDIELIGIIDTFTSLIWTRRYHRAGKFELHLALNEDNVRLFRRGNIIYKTDDKEAGYITARQLATAESGDESLIVRGMFLTGYLGQRINWGRINYSGNTELLMRQLVNDNSINPSNIDRKIANLVLGEVNGFNNSIEYQNSFGNILECLGNISNTSEIGYRAILDIVEKKIIFETYRGVNRTVSNGLIAPTIFSRDFENILKQEYFESVGDYKNTALIAGTGEGEERRLTSIEEGQGLDRYEVYVDARDISDELEDEEIMPDNEYLPLLNQRGKEKLAEHKEITTFDSKVDVNGNSIYKENFDLGDVVTIVDGKWKLKIDTRITEIEEIHEKSGKQVNVIFGNKIPTLLDVIKREVK